MSDVFVNNKGIFVGKKSPNFESVVKADGTVIANTFDDPIIMLNNYNVSFDRESNIHDPMGWKDYSNKGQYTVYVPMMGEKMRQCSPSFIIVIKDEEVVIKSMETFSLTREILRDTLKEMFNTAMFGKTGSKNVFMNGSDEKQAAVIVDRDSEFNLLESLLGEFNIHLLVKGGVFDVINPDHKADGRLGFCNGRWYVIEPTDSYAWYRVVSEIEFPDGAKSVRQTVNYSDGTMKLITLCNDGNFMLSSHTQTDLLFG